METKLEKLYKREGELVHQINSIARWSGLGFCVGELLELKEVRNKIATLKGQD